MSWQQRLRHIALSQVRAIKERLDRIDAEMDDEYLSERHSRDAAIRELDKVGEMPVPGRPHPAEPAAELSPSQSTQTTDTGTTAIQDERSAKLSRAYRIMGVQDGADLSEVEAAYRKLSARCRAAEFPEGSEERETADAIMARVNEAYNTLREELNPAAARFDKLEL